MASQSGGRRARTRHREARNSLNERGVNIVDQNTPDY